MKLLRIARRVGIATGALALGLGAYLGMLQLTGNFHEVIAGKFYRSAQLSPEKLAAYIDRYGIKTVINLRGESPQSEWYRREAETLRAHNARLVDFHMSARRQLTVEESRQLVDLMRNAEGPILIHCKAGADRTGLASVMYLQQVAGVDEETAEWQLSPLYGHINLPFLSVYAMDDTWETFEKAIGLDS
ncbi:protein tyrosine phosphatase [Rhizobium sp. ACO-34A]|nr:dual specificity protein phosphatase family protein [Rhizobium sp. ACO-34A]ATN35120.1 protein tyrosine phosphatase [Rhizobium sp. ACO-34A]